MSAFWNTTGLFLYDNPITRIIPAQSTTLRINLLNLPPHHELYISLSAALGYMNDPNLMCLASFVDTDLASGSTFRHIIDADEMVLTKLFWNHTLAN